jgi:undecaprenyl-diphosphatase
MTMHSTITTQPQTGLPRKSGFLDLHSPGLLAKRPIIGLIIFIFGLLMFGALTYNLYNQGPLLEWDKVIANTLPAIALKSPAYVISIMDAGFYIGKQVLLVLDVLLCLYFLLKRYWPELAMAALGLSGAGTLFSVLSNYFGRPRPPIQVSIIVNLPGYPSGHAVSVVVFYGLLAYLLVPKMPSAFWKAVVVIVTLLIIAFVGFSRIFTGGHYLTDVLAGYAVGIAWSGAVYTLIELLFQKIMPRRAK